MFPSRGRLFSSGLAVATLVGLLAMLCVASATAQEESGPESTPSADAAGDAAGDGAADGEQDGLMGGLSGMLVPIIGMGLIFYFIVLAPQKKARKKQQALVDSLKKHDRVVTIGGIVGTIVSIDTDNEEVVLEVGPDTQLRLLRRSIQGPKPFGSDDEAESGDKK